LPEVPCRATKKVGDRGPVVVVSGPPGSGKSTYARRLARDYCLDYVTSGGFFRRLAREAGLTLEELSLIAAKDPSIDLRIDSEVVKAASRGGIVVDSHLAAWTLAGVADVSVVVTAPLAVRVARIASREEGSVGRVLRETLAREETQWTRFHEYYGYDTHLAPAADLVLDTSTLSIDEAYSIIKALVEAKLARLGYL